MGGSESVEDMEAEGVGLPLLELPWPGVEVVDMILMPELGGTESSRCSCTIV